VVNQEADVEPQAVMVEGAIASGDKIQQILNFWFGTPTDGFYGQSRPEWFRKDSVFDGQLRSRFLDTYHQAAQGQLDCWQETPEGCLALILVLDQFPRNLFRQQSQAFATDEKALAIAQFAIDRQFDRALIPIQRWFIYLPFEHSENLDRQRQSLQLFRSLGNDGSAAQAIAYAQQHYDIIAKFGRFPHRNAILGRESTLEELEFLKQPDSSF
jgi:uncharacterized protein (DUF924 family)